MASTAGHLGDDELAALDDGARLRPDARAHVQQCAECRRRSDELLRLRMVLAQTGEREFAPARDVVPGALKRLRLRRNGITNANELLDSLVALMRGFAALFSVDGRPIRRPPPRIEDDANG